MDCVLHHIIVNTIQVRGVITMRKNTKSFITLMTAIKRGYTITKDGVVRNPSNVIISGNISNSTGYIDFSIRVEGVRMRFMAHQLQAYTKFGEKLFETQCVRHLNGVRTDNSWGNIQIGTLQQNSMDIPKSKRIEIANYASKHIFAFNKEQVRNILNDRNNGLTYKELCKKYKTSKSTLSYFFNKSQYVKNVTL